MEVAIHNRILHNTASAKNNWLSFLSRSSLISISTNLTSTLSRPQVAQQGQVEHERGQAAHLQHLTGGGGAGSLRSSKVLVLSDTIVYF